MTTTTDNHGWTIPEDGESDWGTILNTFFDDELELDVPLIDTIGNRPSAGSSAPKLFVSTDETSSPNLYYNDGSSWSEVTGGSQRAEEEIDDFVDNLLVGGTNVSLSYDDVNDTLTISATDTDTQLSDSEVQTAINDDSDHGSTASHNYATSASDLSDVSPDSTSDAHHSKTPEWTRTDVTSTSTTIAAWDSVWVDTGAAGGNVTLTTPADANVADGDRVEVGVEVATNDVSVSANTNQQIIGSNPTLTQRGSSLTLEYKASNSTWMVK